MFFIGFAMLHGLYGQNSAPQVRPPHKYTATVGQTICINVATEDADAADTVYLSLVNSPYTSQWSSNSGLVRLGSGQLCCTPSNAEAGSTWEFLFMAHDGKDTTYDTIEILIKGMPARHSFNHEEIGCGRWRYQAGFNSWTKCVNLHLVDEQRNIVYSYGICDSNLVVSDTVQLYEGKYQMITEMIDGIPNQNIVLDSFTISRGARVFINGPAHAKAGEIVYLKGEKIAGETPFKTYWVVEQNGVAQTMAEDTDSFAMQQFQTTTYRYIAHGRDLCLYESAKIVQTSSALNTEISSKSAFPVYPNPAKDRVSLNPPLNSGILSLLDANGRILKEIHFSNQEELTLEISTLSPGIYLFRIQSDSGELYSSKWIKQ